ncbi:MAG: hypothetical protein ACXWQO_11260 [Bdellovibrionota bacterium]
MNKTIFAIVAMTLVSASTAFAYAPLPSSVTKVFEYSCQKRFFEGEGVRPEGIQCVGFQHLGFYQASYTYYLYESASRNNFQWQGRTAVYPGNICGMPQVDRYTCEASPHIAFALSEFPEGPYVARVQMTASPEGQVEAYGYVAVPDRYTGECEQGLVKAYVNVAELGPMRFPLPTNFPIDGSSNNYAIRMEGTASLPYELTRIPASTPCDGRGFCRWPDGHPYTAASNYYRPVGNAFCVIPTNRLVQ